MILASLISAAPFGILGLVRFRSTDLEAGIAHICRLRIAEHHAVYGDVPFLPAGLTHARTYEAEA